MTSGHLGNYTTLTDATGFFESIGVIDCSFECQSCNRSYTRHCHHPHAHRVLRCRALHASIQFQIVLKEDRTGIKQRKNRVREHFIHLEHGSDEGVEGTVPG